MEKTNSNKYINGKNTIITGMKFFNCDNLTIQIIIINSVMKKEMIPIHLKVKLLDPYKKSARVEAMVITRKSMHLTFDFLK